MAANAETSYQLRFEPEAGRRSKAAFEMLDERLTADGFGHVEGWVDMAGIDFVVLIELTSPAMLNHLLALLEELDLADLCTVTQRQEFDEDEDEEDGGEWL